MSTEAAASLLERISHSSILLLIALSGLSQVLIIGFYDLFPFKSLLDYVYLRTTSLQSFFAYHLDGDVEYRDKSNAEKLAHQSGLDITAHIVTTFDGFKLTLHRCRKDRVDEPNGNSNSDCLLPSLRGSHPPVLIIHGLMQDSEAFLCGENNLTDRLLRAGFDVWLANNRGNKYSTSHVKFTDRDNGYWDFSLDDLAQRDTPAIINYILKSTGFPKLAVIGFSQGSAQIFGLLSDQPEMCAKVSVFVALAPPIFPVGAKYKSVLMEAAQHLPFFINMLFGWKAMLPVVPSCQRICSKRVFANMVATSMSHLFGWAGTRISRDRKRDLFQHVYSPSSVKIVVHWFQMIVEGRLCYYKPFTWSSVFGRLFRRADDKSIDGVNERPAYDLSKISCPVAAIAGASDHVINPFPIESAVQKCVKMHIEPDYEHLDLIWADDAHEKIFPAVIDALKTYNLP
jgi:lysosomal acid lipase/cholesteryl ester hydrolase